MEGAALAKTEAKAIAELKSTIVEYYSRARSVAPPAAPPEVEVIIELVDCP